MSEQHVPLLLLAVKRAESFVFGREAVLLIGLVLGRLSLGCLKSEEACLRRNTLQEWQ